MMTFEEPSLPVPLQTQQWQVRCLCTVLHVCADLNSLATAAVGSPH